MLIALILMFAEAQRWLWGPAQSLANETVKHYGVTINKAEGLRTGQLIILLVEMLSFVFYKPDTCKYKPAYKKSGSFLRKYL